MIFGNLFKKKYDKIDAIGFLIVNHPGPITIDEAESITVIVTWVSKLPTSSVCTRPYLDATVDSDQMPFCNRR